MRFGARAALLAGFSVAGAAAPSSFQADEARAGALPAQISLVALSSADVLLDPGGAGPTADDLASAPRGKVADVVLSTSDGQVVCAALSIGKLLGKDDRVVLVPATVLKYARIGKETGFLLRMTQSELRALPDFDVKKNGKDGLDRAVKKALGATADAGERGRKEPSEIREKEAPASSTLPPTYALSSRLTGADVSASDALCGKVHDAAVDVSTHAITYLVVSRGDGASVGVSLYVVPLRAFRWTGPAERSELKLEKTIEQLKAAPEYKPSGRGLISPEQMKAADAFFGGGKVAGAGPK
jgi:hypothetical protein